jgi:glyoxylase-like metal-dependent hydrolase (beta-lactamase superfamily II)
MAQRDRRVQQISERTWIYRQDWQRVEPAIGMVLSDKGWIAIEGGSSPAHGRRVYEAMQQIRERPVLYVINTHRHFDHVFGNQAFRAPVIASRRCRERFAQNIQEDWAPDRVQRWLQETMFPSISTLNPSDFQGLQLVPPSLSFAGEMVLDLDGTRALLFPLAGAHSDDSIGVYLPYERVLFLGDAFYFREGSEGRFFKLLELLDYVAPLEVEFYVPGHERAHDRGTFAKVHSYFHELVHSVRSLLRSGAGEAEVLTLAFDAKYEGTSFLSPKLHRRFLHAAYRELLAERSTLSH